MKKNIKLTLLGTLFTSSALAITLPIVSCSASNNKILTIVSAIGNPDYKIELETKVNELLTFIMQDSATNKDQQGFANALILGSRVNDAIFTQIKKTIKFEDSNKNVIPFDEVVSKIFYVSKTIVSTTAGVAIQGPIIRIDLKYGFTTNEKLIEINSGHLGNSK